MNDAANNSEMSPEAKERAEALQGFRDLISWYAQHPEVPLPELTVNNYAVDNLPVTARALGTFTKKYSEGMFYLNRQFGPVNAVFCFMREQACVRRVIGKKHVEARVIPAEYIPAHDEDIVEWDCQPILKESEPTI